LCKSSACATIEAVAGAGIVKKLSSFLVFTCIGFILASCAASDKKPLAETAADEAALLEAMSRAAIVVTGSPRLSATKPSTISWLGNLDVVGKHKTLSADELRLHLTQVINQQIMIKGYPMLSDGGDFQLDGVVILSAAEDENVLLRESGGMDPGLAGIGDESQLGKGTLVLELKQGRVTRWKGTVQIYIAPHFDETVALRRIEYAVAQLLGTWP